MNMAEAVRSVLRKYFDFSGRASRAEYWWFSLAETILFTACFFGMFSGVDLTEPVDPTNFLSIDFGPFGNLCLWVLVISNIFLFIPGLAVTVRRLHDAGFSGALIFLNLIPSIGGLIVTVLLVMPSNAGGNRFGYHPDGPSLTRADYDARLGRVASERFGNAGPGSTIGGQPGMITPAGPGFGGGSTGVAGMGAAATGMIGQYGQPSITPMPAAPAQPSITPMPAAPAQPNFQPQPSYPPQQGYQPQPEGQQQPAQQGYPQQGYPQQPAQPTYPVRASNLTSPGTTFQPMEPAPVPEADQPPPPPPPPPPYSQG